MFIVIKETIVHIAPNIWKKFRNSTIHFNFFFTCFNWVLPAKLRIFYRIPQTDGTTGEWTEVGKTWIENIWWGMRVFIQMEAHYFTFISGFVVFYFLDALCFIFPEATLLLQLIVPSVVTSFTEKLMSVLWRKENILKTCFGGQSK